MADRVGQETEKSVEANEERKRDRNSHWAEVLSGKSFFEKEEVDSKATASEMDRTPLLRLERGEMESAKALELERISSCWCAVQCCEGMITPPQCEHVESQY